jgi:Fe-S cluster assembly iron-binding protein IscA
MVNVTESAVKKLHEMRAEQPDKGFRVVFKGFG